ATHIRADRSDRRCIQGRGRLRPQLCDMQGQVCQCFEFPWLSTPAGKRCSLRLCLRWRQFRRRPGGAMKVAKAIGARPEADEIVAEALSWLGTPYRHQAYSKGVGCDCLGLIRGVWRSLYGDELEVPADYTPDWAEA